MKYNYDEKTNKMLEELQASILEEYDNSPAISVRLNLLPMNHNAYDKYVRIKNEDGTFRTEIREHKVQNPVKTIAIHEATPGKADGSMPTKPPRYVTDVNHYERLVKSGTPKNPRPYGDSTAYHAMVAYPGLFGNPEIVLYLPATSSPEQLANKPLTKYAYGIERLCGEEQNYHLAIANQAMLAAFVLREIGYDKQAGAKHVFPHQFFARNNKACPARMLYATDLLEKTKTGKHLTQQEEDALKEYVPWDVFVNLVETFYERDKYPLELEQKFIMDHSDYEAYKKDPEHYNYAERRKFKEKTPIDPIRIAGPADPDYSYLRPIKPEENQNLTFKEIKYSKKDNKTNNNTNNNIKKNKNDKDDDLER